MNQALGLYLLDAIPQLDREAPDYALNVISLIEAILENPEVILRKQVDLLKGELIGQLKSEGVEYDERMALLEQVEWPKPGKDFIYDTYNAFVAKRPWMKIGLRVVASWLAAAAILVLLKSRRSRRRAPSASPWPGKPAT